MPLKGAQKGVPLKGVLKRVRGDLSGMRSHYAKAPYVATCRVSVIIKPL